MKVYGMTTTPPHKWRSEARTVRVIVAAPSRKAAAAAFRACGLNYSDYAFAQYASESGNSAEREVSLGNPGVLFWTPERGLPLAADYRRAGA